MALQKRSYLPRSTIDYAALRGIYEFAENNKISFGKALEKLLLQSKDFNTSLESLTNGSEWFSKDVADFKKSIN